MALTDRRTLPVPYGHRGFVINDLLLSPQTDPSSRPVHELVNLLNDTDDAAIVVLAGNIFDVSPTTDLRKFINATFAQLSELDAAVAHFVSGGQRAIVLLPGAVDTEISTDDLAHAVLNERHIQIASDLILQVASAHDVRDVAIVAGSSFVDELRVHPADRADARRLDDPEALQRFVASRVLYRMLSKWVWFPLWAMAIFDLTSTVLRVVNHFTRHHLRVRTFHPSNLWADVFINLIIIAVFEAAVVLVAGLTVRWRFRTASKVSALVATVEPLSATMVDDVDALELARRINTRGGVGAVVGGAPRPALAFLDNGVSAAAGPSRIVFIEREGRLGLPPVFTPVERVGIVEIEAASDVQVRLYVGGTTHAPATLLERLVGGRAAQPTPPDTTAIVGSWPTGDPWPIPSSRLRLQRRQRTIRRLVSFLLFLTGVANVVVAVSPPLRSRLHTVLSVLPIGVAQSAAAVTAVAGVGMIMMARGVRRGQRRAWLVASGLLAVTIFAHLARGGNPRDSLLALFVLGFLIVERRYFKATTDRGSIRSTFPRLALIGATAVIAATIGIELGQRHHHLPSWPTVMLACAERLVGISLISLPDAAADFVGPALLFVGVSLIVTGLYLLTRPVVDRRLSLQGTSTERRIAELRARDIVRRHGRGSLDYFALRDDKQFFFFRDSLVAYAVYGGVALISPDPIGPVAERTEVFSNFRSFAEANGWTIGVMAAGEDWLSIYHAAGLRYLYFGDEAIVNCSTFSLEGGKMKGLRQACTRLERKGYTIEFLDPATIEPRRVSDLVDLMGLLRRGEGERGFSMMLGRLFNPKDKGLLLTVVYGPDERPAALCQFVPSPAINGFSLDIMRRDPGDHPNGLIDYALCSTIAHLARHGGSHLSLNFAAFRSVLDGEKGEGAFTKVERWALRRLSGVLPIETLWSFNAKYHPDWLPRHICYPAAESFVPVVTAILRAESLTEIPLLGRLLTNDPTNRPATVVPDEILEQARNSDSLQ